MSDITKHKWSDKAICLLKGEGCFALTNDKQVTLATGQVNWINLNKDDAIAIAKHFDLLDFSSKGILHPGESVSIRFHDGIKWIKAPKDLSVTWHEDV